MRAETHAALSLSTVPGAANGGITFSSMKRSTTSAVALPFSCMIGQPFRFLTQTRRYRLPSCFFVDSPAKLIPNNLSRLLWESQDDCICFWAFMCEQVLHASACFETLRCICDHYKRFVTNVCWVFVSKEANTSCNEPIKANRSETGTTTTIQFFTLLERWFAFTIG